MSLAPFWVVLDPFWSLFGRFLVPGAICENMHPSRARIKFSRVWGVPSHSFFALFSASSLGCVFHTIFDGFLTFLGRHWLPRGCPLGHLGHPF